MSGDEGTDGLREELDHLVEQVRGLEARVAALEGIPASVRERAAVPEAEIPPVEEPVAAPAPASAAPPGPPPRPVDVTPGRIIFLTGLSVLALAGAFLLRALTDNQTFPPMVGFGLGTLYSLLLVFLAFRGAGRGDSLGGSWWGVTSTIVAYPFLVESVGILHLVSPLVGAVAFALITFVGLACAWWRSMQLLSWAYVLAALATGFLLASATETPVPFTLGLLGLGIATVFLAYQRSWALQRWVVALAVDGMILRLVAKVTDADFVAAESTLTTGGVLLLALLLLVAYLAVFIDRALIRARGVKAFDVVQSVAVVLIGFGGAVRIARTTGSGEALLGWVALAAALLGYGVAFTFVRRRLGRGRGFFYFASLALVFLVLGSRVVAQGPWLAWSWITLGVVTTLLGGYYRRVTLQGHSLVYLALGAFAANLIPLALEAFDGSPPPLEEMARPVTILALAALVFAYLAAQRFLTEDDDSTSRRFIRFGFALLAVQGLAGLLVSTMAGPLGGGGVKVAVAATGVMSAGAVLLSLAGRCRSRRELGWLAYLVLALGLAKLLIQDLRLGDPLALFLSFGMLGTALILVPRILLSGREKTD